ncbi:MAG: phosphotransferase [Lentisphaerae bacterium]|nr:phosphotransferase [Lentisphaerota bacterium]
MRLPLIQAVRKTVSAAFATEPERIEPLAGGANNRVFKVRLGRQAVLAKVYFRHPGDRRDRLSAEFGMLAFLWQNGLRCIPEPLFADRQRHIGLYQFVEGRRPRPEEIAWSDVSELIFLLKEMWRLRRRPDAAALPRGSDSSFSMAGFLANVEGRFRCVARALKTGRVSPEARQFVAGEVAARMKAVRQFIERGARNCALDLERPLPPAQRTLNPADHGFHNALRGSSGRLTFLDFEYAGWDDPAQMICNACLQPEVPIPAAMQPRFVKTIAGALGNPAGLAARLKLLYPLFGLKWSLIMLNEFLPVSRERRRFALKRPDDSGRRKEQLRKSQRQAVAVASYLAAPVFFDCLD